jgi:hypothetical protein
MYFFIPFKSAADIANFVLIAKVGMGVIFPLLYLYLVALGYVIEKAKLSLKEMAALNVDPTVAVQDDISRKYYRLRSKTLDGTGWKVEKEGTLDEVSALAATITDRIVRISGIKETILVTQMPEAGFVVTLH